MQRWTSRLGWTAWLVVALVLAGGDSRPARQPGDALHRFTAPIEFDFGGWTAGAAAAKLAQSTLGGADYLLADRGPDLVRSYLTDLAHAQHLQREVERIFADPLQSDPQTASAGERRALADLRRRLAENQPTVEAVLESQAAVVLAEAGLTSFGRPVPPVSFHLSRLPVALVASPRETIRQDALIQLLPDLTLEAQVALEQQVEAETGLSALVVPVGGIGTYPTMVQETTALDWMVEVVLHEWVHNYLTFRPLGWVYDASPATRTMNETAASLLGKAFGRRLLELYYPERVPPPVPDRPPPAEETEAPPAFDFNAEMHVTRVEVDRLLAAGRVAEAEAYMEARRQILIENGYAIRRLNQAYFAFHGAYAEAPQSAAGEDPVGEAVRELWARSVTPADFLRTMARMDSYDDLLAALAAAPTTAR